MLDFSNTNTVWGSILAETFKRLGLTTAVICPGSRSTPLTIAFAQTHGVEAIPILDERSAAFFALGIARQTGLPVVLVCTSGTAAANFYPAIIEARESRVPLIVLTADRPPELRDCRSGQTINQTKLYGTYPNWYAELALPSLDIEMLAYLRQTLIYAWERSRYPVPGVVHLNIPFRDPLAPIPDTATKLLQSQFQPEEFFSGITNSSPLTPHPGLRPASLTPLTPLQEWQQHNQGIIIAGLAQPQQPREYCGAIAQLAKTLKFPVLAEALSPVRNYADLNPYLISIYDLIVRNPQLAQQLQPEIVIQIGELPTSKDLRHWLSVTQPQRWIVDPCDHNLDPLHGKTIHLRTTVEQLAQLIEPKASTTYLQLWCDVETKVRSACDRTMAEIDHLFEGKAAWLLSQVLPPETPLFIANSMPVRDMEFFWKPSNSNIRPFFNRGANGIDGTLSTALGVAHRNQSSVLLTGDLTLLHDTNGFLINNKFIGHLTIVLINNNGGGIFEMLPISKFEPPFEKFFATPQNIDFAQLCATYNVEHELIQSWEHLQQKLNSLPITGIRVLELKTDRKADAKWRKDNLGKLATEHL
ncbi:2-succinyl-5-enolpyruvyl-6-hydroxy-3-cyclohexene-1-carboxylic-acid synthase [Gloeocapsopsis dulcis]|uniref:2-succinyl-5-enolpyruvyl-6-hydroxy-3-cyclohexene-1-carboxylate synthase n=1 Tax=Gloeocapsopsis dulcis AAB1 = 1H9 TaxID=1433147 RepID=A0A6N8FYM5_9CHRO|nr:2-succinyl-5-enolpyruvyl-6-hydroxy-3-cyclohexene-1-carboxylic-acid synthase [Gloeocapsopsis dulcis]MUL37712.1 2-succinyl-5-enolpyruvyl-6-hydroxy-3-cyclohexene-1-carboxylic-acid synthase [Gloeocapsopsis dulcis AAB1 = 1H9]WNN88458.1 2-succinyl-5-enolpyruvyl-6-hydroxy-3-cyclohexene-1-carboxylic-acid synthase [Gloeocapsopsis dulcis]